jgi:hypothetical protein
VRVRTPTAKSLEYIAISDDDASDDDHDRKMDADYIGSNNGRLKSPLRHQPRASSLSGVRLRALRQAKSQHAQSSREARDDAKYIS